MLDISGLSNYYSETSVYMILFTMSITILLSLILVFTYDKTTAPAGRSFSFIQSLMLMSVVTATIMQSIGDSLALSFGIFGALSGDDGAGGVFVSGHDPDARAGGGHDRLFRQAPGRGRALYRACGQVGGISVRG